MISVSNFLSRISAGMAALAWLVSSADRLSADAVLEGHVTLPKALTSPVMNKRYEVITSGGVLSPNPPRAVVYLEGGPTLSAQPASQQVVQTNFAFVPSLLPIQVGTRVEFPNFDPTFHNVFSYSPPKRFDLGRYRPDERPVPSQWFDKPGLVTLRCDIHEHMRGLILVLETPYFVLSDTDGHYHFDHLPAGRFTLKAWINSKTTLEKPVEIPASGTVRVDFD